MPHHADDYVHRIGRTGRAGRTGTAITVVAPADGKAVAAIEKLIGQSIPWMGGEGAPGPPSALDVAEHLDSEPNRGRSATSDPQRRTAQRRSSGSGRQRNGEHRESGGRCAHGSRLAAATATASWRRLPRLDDVRPRRAQSRHPKSRLMCDDSAGHLPAFLLRPFRVQGLSTAGQAGPRHHGTARRQ